MNFELTKKRSRRYPAKTITDADYANDIVILANAHAQAETLLHSQERAAAGIGLPINTHKTEFMCFNQTDDISWRQHPTKHQLYGYLPPITKTIKVERSRYAGHCWRIRDELISGVLLWTPSHGRAKAGWPAQTYIQQLCEDTGCSPEDQPEAMNDREGRWERVRDICADGVTRRWWQYEGKREWTEKNNATLKEDCFPDTDPHFCSVKFQWD